MDLKIPILSYFKQTHFHEFILFDFDHPEKSGQAMEPVCRQAGSPMLIPVGN